MKNFWLKFAVCTILPVVAVLFPVMAEDGNTAPAGNGPAEKTSNSTPSTNTEQVWSLLTEKPPELLSLENFRYARYAERCKDDTAHDRYAILLDDVFWERVRNPLTEIRLRSDDGRLLPFAVERSTETAVKSKELQLPGKMIGSQSLPDGRYAVDFELEELSDISAVELNIAGPEFSRMLTILIGDGRAWHTAFGPRKLIDCRKTLGVSTRKLPFQQPWKGRIIRLIFGIPGQPTPEKELPMEGIKAYRMMNYEVTDSPRLIDCRWTLIESRSDKEQTILEYRAGGTPVTRLAVQTQSDYFLRKATLFGSDNRKLWTELANGMLRKLDLDFQLVLEFPENRYKFYRLEIHNGSADPLKELNLSAQGPEYNLLISGENASSKLLIFFGTSAPQSALEWKAGSRSASGDGQYTLQNAMSNPLRQVGVQTAVSSFRFMLGTLILLFGLLLLFLLPRQLAKSSGSLPSDVPED